MVNGVVDVRSCSEMVEVAEWVRESQSLYDQQVGALVPAVFESYAKISHSWGSEDAAVASGAGVDTNLIDQVTHEPSTFRAVEARRPVLPDAEPQAGTVPAGLAAELVGILADQTRDRERCYFAVWSGFAGLTVDCPDSPQVVVGNREMILLDGYLSDALTTVTAGMWRSASAWWPAGRQWFVATDVDLTNTYVGGRRQCINAVLAIPGIQGAMVDPGESTTLA